MRVGVRHPTNHPNFTIVLLDTISLGFSYETVVGFAPPFGEWVVSENLWSTTTGKHINYLNSDPKARLPREEFLGKLEAAMP